MSALAGIGHDLLFDYTLRTVALGSAALGLLAGMLGAFAVLRRQSLLGDAVSHAALPGIVLAFMLTGTKTPLVLVLGAAITGWIAALLLAAIKLPDLLTPIKSLAGSAKELANLARKADKPETKKLDIEAEV